MGSASSDVLWTPSVKSGLRDKQYGELSQYCSSLYSAERRKTRSVEVGDRVRIGSEHPYVRQTMTTATTSDVEGTIAQVMKCSDEGFDLIRLTVQGKREANECLKRDMIYHYVQTCIFNRK